MMTLTPRQVLRRGFTLVELLVVISLIAVLAGMAILVAPRFGDGNKQAMAASKVQGWFAIAKQRAYRDKIICGVRLYPDAADPRTVKVMEYIEQPNDFTGGQIVCTAGANTAVISPNAAGAIAAGDFLVIDGDPYAAHKITKVVDSSSGPNATQLTLASNVLITTAGTTKYHVVRQPRASTGEPQLIMQNDMVVWLPLSLPTTSGSNPSQLVGPVDVLFSPSGGAEFRDATGPTSAGKLVLWICDITKPTRFDGEPTLIAVYGRTGAVAAHPVNVNASVGDNYHFTKDGRNSGL